MQSTTESSTETILRTETIAPATDGGGLMKEVLREGDGATPSYGDRVTAHYTGRLLSGDVFDSSVTRGRPFEFNIGKQEVIKGWDQGFATMRVGERAFLTCGPGYAYGDRGAGDKIPANATLRFEVELLATKPTPPKGIPGARLAKAEGTAAFEGGDLVGAIEAWTRGWQEVEYEVVEEGALGDDLRGLKTALRSNAAMAYLKRGVRHYMSAFAALRARGSRKENSPLVPIYRYRNGSSP